MTSIKLAFWYLWRSFINGMKRAYKLVLGMMLFIAAFALLIGVISRISPDESPDEPEEEITEENGEYAINTDFDVVEEEDGSLTLYLQGETYDITLFLPEFLCAIIALFVFVSAIWNGAKKGVEIFGMPDVNFLFPAPMKPQSVLLFRLIGQIGTTMLAYVYIIWQVPNMVANGLPVPSAVCIVIAVLVLAIVSRFVSVLTYVLLSKHRRIRQWVCRYGFALFFVPFLIVALLWALRMPLYKSFYTVFGSNVSRFVPFWGWLKAFAVFGIMGQYKKAALFLLLTVCGSVLMIWLTWRIDADFYEEAIENASAQALQMEQLQQSAAGGTSFGVKHEGAHEEKKWEKFRNRVLYFEGYEGGKVFFCKTILNRKRFYPLGGLYSPTCSLYLWATLGAVLFLRFVVHSQQLLPVVLMLFAFMFFRSFANPMAQELAHNFIYLIPERPFVLLGWGMAGQLLEGALDLFPAMIAAFLMGAGTGNTVAWFAVLLSAHLFFGTVALMVDLVVPYYLSSMLSGILQFILRFIPFIPVGIVLLMGVMADSMLIPLLMVVLINTAVSLLAFLPCPYFLHRGKR